MIEFDENASIAGTNIKIIGVGGAGGNAVNAMIKNNLENVEFIVANTDSDDLKKSKAQMKIQLGRNLTRGLGTGADPEVGAKSAEESRDEIKSHIEGADMLFIAAGMGGGTGTGAAPMVAKYARELGILTLGIVTTPFDFEGVKREANAKNGVKNLGEFVDSLIIIPNNKLSEIYGNTSLIEAFSNADKVLYEAAKAVSDIITITGMINVDFADVKSVMQNMGHALMGTGVAEGEDRAIKAARAAITNPLLSDISLDGCSSLLINVTCGTDFMMIELSEVSNVVVSATGREANVIMGVILDEKMAGKLSVTIIATGLAKQDESNIDDSLKMPVFDTEIIKTEDNKESIDEIQQLFKSLDINKSGKEEQMEVEEITKERPMRTDVPSFLKSLD